MLTLINGTTGVPLQIDDYYVRQIDSGYDQLKFEISIFDAQYQQIQEESVIREQSNSTTTQRYLVKAIDAGAERAQVICEIDLDEWKSGLRVNYNSGSNTVAGILSSVRPTGWAVTDLSGLSYSRTIALEAATALDVADACRTTFGVCLRWDTINRIVTIVNPSSYIPVGSFVTRDLNLKENNYKGKSSGFATRLYAYGADGLSFASINGGREYIDNNTYSNKIVCSYWHDDRYTIKENLLADARKRLASMAIPSRSYDCAVYDLARTDPDRYSYQDFSLFAVVALIDTTRSNTKIYHQVVELWIYPYHPQDNRVVLSTSPAKIQSQLTNLTASVTSPISEWSQMQAAEQELAIENATDQITGNSGGYVLIGLDVARKPYEICIMDTNDKSTAQRVWRWNLNGLGYSSTGYSGNYGLAMTQDGSIVADYIRTGALSSSQVTVGGFTLSTTSLHNGMTSLTDITHNGVYVGTDGIALGAGNFKVDAAGNLIAKTATIDGTMNITNGSINLGNGAFRVTNAGALTASSATITGGSLAIGSKFAVDSQGNMTATGATITGSIDITGGEISIGNKFRVDAQGNMTASSATVSGAITITSGSISIGGKFSVDAQGNLTATSGTFSGNVYANQILAGGDYGYISGSQIGSATISGSNIGSATISGGNIGSSTITGGNLASYTVTNDNIGIGAIVGGNGSAYGGVANIEVGTVGYGNSGGSATNSISASGSDGITGGLNANNVFSGVTSCEWLKCGRFYYGTTPLFLFGPAKLTYASGTTLNNFYFFGMSM